MQIWTDRNIGCHMPSRRKRELCESVINVVADGQAAGPQYAKKWVNSTKKNTMVEINHEIIFGLCSKWLNISLCINSWYFWRKWDEKILTFEGKRYDFLLKLPFIRILELCVCSDQLRSHSVGRFCMRGLHVFHFYSIREDVRDSFLLSQKSFLLGKWRHWSFYGQFSTN